MPSAYRSGGSLRLWYRAWRHPLNAGAALPFRLAVGRAMCEALRPGGAPADARRHRDAVRGIGRRSALAADQGRLGTGVVVGPAQDVLSPRLAPALACGGTGAVLRRGRPRRRSAGSSPFVFGEAGLNPRFRLRVAALPRRLPHQNASPHIPKTPLRRSQPVPPNAATCANRRAANYYGGGSRRTGLPAGLPAERTLTPPRTGWPRPCGK